MTKRNMASALSFAHLAGVTAKEDGDDKDDKKEKKEGATSEKDGDDEKDEDKDPSGKAGADDDEKDDDKEATAAEEDDDKKDDKGKDGKKAVRAAVTGERARCATILASRAAARNLPLACHLAFSTDMSAQSAITALKDSAATARPSRHNPDLGPSQVPGGSTAATIATSWDRAMDKAGPKKIARR